MVCMNGPLRKIALTVEQADSNSYAWVLFESAGGRVFILKKAQRPNSSYLKALNAGYEELAMLSACGLHERGLGHDSKHDAEPLAVELVEMNDAT